MSGRLPVHIDPLRLADEGRRLLGELPGSTLTRLREVVNAGSPAAVVAVNLEFARSAQGARRMYGTISTTVELTCQRCLEPVSIRLEARPDVVLLATDTGPSGMAEAADTLVAEAPVALGLLVEDELLLVLPMVPMHPEGACQAPVGMAGNPEGRAAGRAE